MKASPLVLMLDTLLELVEQRFGPEDPAGREDLLLLGRQLHRLNGVYIRLVETRLGPKRIDRITWIHGPKCESSSIDL